MFWTFDQDSRISLIISTLTKYVSTRYQQYNFSNLFVLLWCVVQRHVLWQNYTTWSPYLSWKIKWNINVSPVMISKDTPSSLSLYWSEFVLPFWLLSALGSAVMSVGASGTLGVSAEGCSKSFCSFFSYTLRVEAEQMRHGGETGDLRPTQQMSLKQNAYIHKTWIQSDIFTRHNICHYLSNHWRSFFLNK